MFDSNAVVALAHQLGQRCLLKIVVAATSSSEKNSQFLSETEREGLISLLQLLQSAYTKRIWQNLAFVSFGTGTKALF